ncbi:MAG TPA: hypothetical protein VJP02_02805 [Candidatus Sulfotelmatobacter sp.]|nr:hypothetical protein [Candidatus Sulfotelmatobacter sp.]
MLDLGDKRWNDFKGGYRIRFDPRPLLRRLESGRDDKAVWLELWNELHHQGDVGEASYAAVPHLVRIHRARNTNDWNSYAMVATIELARTERGNPELPKWLEPEYFEAIDDLAAFGLSTLERTKDRYVVRGILSVLAISKGARVYGKVLLEYSEDELLDFEDLNLES